MRSSRQLQSPEVSRKRIRSIVIIEGSEDFLEDSIPVEELAALSLRQSHRDLFSDALKAGFLLPKKAQSGLHHILGQSVTARSHLFLDEILKCRFESDLHMPRPLSTL